MRLTKIKLAGFKSFVDPTTVTFPSNLTGVVGPNGCGKSNVIDAVRWVMGELSAKHLRGDSMADVIFNGSSARKPVGKASVELVFDNADGKISGPYASYTEVSLRREVLRDGTSAYYINGGRCRRKDITQLFLGTGLGSRSYAIIEQGMISRVIEARAEDLRAFVEEAAGISRYKERRKETESRIADARENLERLQDVRGEIDKQIRHLQRQAAAARRYQALKEDERRLTAELLALRLRELDRGGEVQDSALRERDIAMQAALADLRAAEAAIEKQRSWQIERSEEVAAAQGRFYSVGADISRAEQQISYVRESLARKRDDLAQAQQARSDVASQIVRDEEALESIRAELLELDPGADEARRLELAATAALLAVEADLATWQAGWEDFNRSLGSAHQTVQVESARIEQLENQQRRLRAQSDRIAVEQETLRTQAAGTGVEELSAREVSSRSAADEVASALALKVTELQVLRGELAGCERELEQARGQRDRQQTEAMSIEALQRAATGRAEALSVNWLRGVGFGDSPRMAEILAVDPGWERAVETVLGDYLEAVSVAQLDDLSAALAQAGESGPGGLVVVEGARAPRADDSRRLGAHVDGPPSVSELLAGVFTVDSLDTALAMRHDLGPGESCVTRNGAWVGRNWVRVPRAADPHAGVLEREQRLKGLRGALAETRGRLEALESQQQGLRVAVLAAESARDHAQSGIQLAHREHADTKAQLDSAIVRAQDAALRLSRLGDDAATVRRELDETEQLLAKARHALDAGLVDLDALDARRPGLEAERDERREALQRARGGAQEAQEAARNLLVRVEGRRSAESAMASGLQRMQDQRNALDERCSRLGGELAGGDAPLEELQRTLAEMLQRRLEVESELSALRGALDEADSGLRTLDEKRVVAERAVHAARESMDEMKLAAQETRVRRESLSEQFAATKFVLEAVLETLAADADTAVLEGRLTEARADLDRLGQVNLAAIDELAQNTERKEYLDRQFADLTSALDTLEQAMRKIDKETRARFEETFERINAGLKQKFPRLFGGGHAYLEMVGDDVLSAGVAVMARPPGKRNVSISQLSGGEKALTAVALVFSIFDLNPAPFCLLDEVDAPLDEHNVGRFCDIVREMAHSVQFIFITHNKATMELASQLLGVTMNEPGVSRLVAVDVDAAVRLAAS